MKTIFTTFWHRLEIEVEVHGNVDPTFTILKVTPICDEADKFYKENFNSSPEGLLAEDCSFLEECAHDWELEKHYREEEEREAREEQAKLEQLSKEDFKC